MNRKDARWWVPLISGPLIFLRSVLSPAYDLLFGWVDRRLARKNEERLVGDVRLALRFLFTQYAGRIFPSEGVPVPLGFDYAFLTVALDNWLLRFTRGRGELGVQVAATFASSDWHDLSLVLSAISRESEIQRGEFRDLWEVSRALEPQMKVLTEFFSINRFNEVKRRLEDDVYRQERTAIREWQAEINSRLYGAKR